VNKRQRKKNCRLCGTKYGRRTFRGGNVFCSTVCRTRWEEEKLIDKIDAALKWEPPSFLVHGTMTGHFSSARSSVLQTRARDIPYHFAVGPTGNRINIDYRTAEQKARDRAAQIVVDSFDP